MIRLKPQKVIGIKVGGVIHDCGKDWFSFEIKPKSRDLREELKEVWPRIRKIENGEDKYFEQPTFKGANVQLAFLNLESLKAYYKDPENNLPYEVFDTNGKSIYRQSRTKTKEKIFNRLEELFLEEEG